MRDLSPGEVSVTVDAVRLLLIGLGLTFERTARNAQQARGVTEPIRR